MKAISFFMLILMLLVSTMPGKAEQAMSMKNCCHKMVNMPQKHQGATKGCDGGMCATVLSCNNCCFLKTEPVKVEGLAIHVDSKTISPYSIGNLSGYANSCWNPPKV
ncbi:hypothetical protein AAFN85_24510 [Mucilaginibacter sp. CAU 1740]|uniref:hypothetical protein n=1 Tax=Mucilaginibacter sp. CAU 1740 TaxID=3140365 RepID=UPI00325B36F2